MDDTAVDYGLVSLFMAEDDDSPPAPGDDGGTGTPSGSPAISFSTNLWIEILQVTNSQAFLRLHNTVSNELYQPQSKTNLTPGEMFWVPGQIVLATGTNADFSPVDASPPNQFFRGEFGTNVMTVSVGPIAIRPGPFFPSGSSSFFKISSSVSAPNLTVYYHMTGSAIEGTDYTNLPNSASFDSFGNQPFISIDPIADAGVAFDEDIIMNLVPTNTYLVSPTGGSDLTTLFDDVSTNGFLQLAVTNVASPSGAGYDPIHNCLMVSVDLAHNGASGNFMQVFSNGAASNWTSVANLQNEIKLTIVQKTTNGFTNGDMFFSNGQHGGIGWLSADGTRSNLNWLSLTNIPDETDVQGGLYVDQTGIFSNDLIAVTGDFTDRVGGGVWRIDSQANAVRLANITNTHLEGVITLPNDPAKYGPWAGKIITGAEDVIPDPLVFAIDTNGVVTSFKLGIQPEDFHIIPTNQDFYLDDLDSNQILKLPRVLLNNYGGDVMITQAGEFNPVSAPAKLFIIHWDGTNFLRHFISDPGGDTDFEHGTFAPIDIPSTNIFNSNGH